MGAIFSRDAKAYGKWSRSHKPKGKGLTGQALEVAVMRVASMFPENVVHGVGR